MTFTTSISASTTNVLTPKKRARGLLTKYLLRRFSTLFNMQEASQGGREEAEPRRKDFP
jgi:hypothetical protein